MTTVASSLPAIASAEEAIAVAQSYADSLHAGVIERDRSGAVPTRLSPGWTRAV